MENIHLNLGTIILTVVTLLLAQQLCNWVNKKRTSLTVANTAAFRVDDDFICNVRFWTFMGTKVLLIGYAFCLSFSYTFVGLILFFYIDFFVDVWKRKRAGELMFDDEFSEKTE